ncbi:RNA-directed DNA polymerase, eukaryota [Tanacetum coccineum]|uniref:RNA-directed DNA polymerase, eukaryota n=1 Tax=Tanacetum coccineum TaxID=301880 RepID=A0ABQ4Z6N1_9ASTR
MGSKRTKEDDVLKISTSVFVTNFPEQTSAKDLWNACKQYGHVVDAFIPNKRSKVGKRFGFVHFIKVFDVERLVGNLCTVWISRHRIHANAARFYRPKGSTSSHQPAMKGKIRDSSIGNTKDNGHRDDVSSYANVVKIRSKGNGRMIQAIVGFRRILRKHIFSCCIMGRVVLWVMNSFFDSVEAKEKFLLSTGVCSWFSQLIQASSEFITDDRLRCSAFCVVNQVHISCSKICKLDRFLMSESFTLSECPNLSAITLDRFLSDHRPILLRESTHDYGPIPFWFFHYWLEMEGFENFVNEVWREAPVDNSNAMINMMNKLKYLKKKIRVWNGMRQSPKTRKHVLKQELADLEMIIDKGDASSDTLHKRAEVVKSIQEVDKLCAMEASQKRVLVEIDWVENPNMVKKRVPNHFKNRFDRPKVLSVGGRIPMHNMDFPSSSELNATLDLESRSVNEELKGSLGLCGVDKISGAALNHISELDLVFSVVLLESEVEQDSRRILRLYMEGVVLGVHA